MNEEAVDQGKEPIAGPGLGGLVAIGAAVLLVGAGLCWLAVEAFGGSDGSYNFEKKTGETKEDQGHGERRGPGRPRKDAAGTPPAPPAPPAGGSGGDSPPA